MPGWDSIKGAETNLLKESLHSVKDAKKINENQIDKLYSSTCFEILGVTNQSGVQESDIHMHKQVFCNNLVMNVGDQLMDIDLAKAIMWNVSDFLLGKSVDVKTEESVVKQQAMTSNSNFINSFGDMKTRCWDSNSVCTPSSKALSNREFMQKYESMMKESLSSIHKKNKKSSQQAEVNLDDFKGRILSSGEE